MGAIGDRMENDLERPCDLNIFSFVLKFRKLRLGIRTIEISMMAVLTGRAILRPSGEGERLDPRPVLATMQALENFGDLV